MATNSLPDSPINFNDQPTNPIQASSIQKTSIADFMDFSNFENAMPFCEILAKTDFCPKNYRGKPFEVMCTIQYGKEIGLSPMQALQTVAVINGKPSIYGDGLIGLCLAFPECEDIQESFDEATITAICRVKRRGMSWVISTYSKQQAVEANLWGKPGPWTQYWKRMLQMRARGFALRDAFADRLKGIITAEEAKDYPVQAEPQFKLVTPIRKEIQVQEPAAKEQTIKQLMFLVKRNHVEQRIIDKWLTKANVDSLAKLTEHQALACIKKIEDEDSTAKRAWILQSRAEKICNDVVEVMPHGFYDDFTDEQLQGAVNHV